MIDLSSLLTIWPVWVIWLVFGFLPGVATRLLSLGFSKDDPRRQELLAEVYAVPRWERPLWVADQAERVVFDGVWERLVGVADGWFFNRWMLGDGAAMHMAYPATFGIPSPEEIALLEPGDVVKLMFEPKGRLVTDDCCGERMWVQVTTVHASSFEGSLDNSPLMFNHLHAGHHIHFKAQHIIDLDYAPFGDPLLECQTSALQCHVPDQFGAPMLDGETPCPWQS